MLAKRLGGCPNQRAIHVQMATLATINHAESCYPRLAQSGMKAVYQCPALPLTGQAEIRLLIMAPVTEIIFGRSHGQGSQQHQADHAKVRQLHEVLAGCVAERVCCYQST